MQDSRNLGEENKGMGSRNRREKQFWGCIEMRDQRTGGREGYDRRT